MPIALPSLGVALAAALRTLRRFPLAILAAALASLGFILSIDDVGADWLHARLMATASLGIPLFIAATLLAERQKRRGAAQVVLALVGAAILVTYFALWPHWSDEVRFGRYAQLSIAFHLLVAFGPVANGGRLNALWQFNRVLLERVALTALFTMTLFLGLALALLALDKLFGVDVPSGAYGRVWAVTAFLFSAWLFLGGVPEHPDALEERRDYPKELRVFAQYALVPLVSAYLVILTLYLGKVVVTWDWPSGWIGWLVSGVATAGILALLLVHPFADDPEQRWINAFARQYWIAILPSVVMLWLALYQRVHQYGVTERRYFLIILSVWLAAIAVYYAISRSRNIRLIPITLCVGAILTMAGPWSAYSVSRASQVGRLRATLERNGMFANGLVRRATRAVSTADRTEISGIVRYLLEVHGTGAIAGWFSDTAAARTVRTAGQQARNDPGSSGSWAEVVVARLGVGYVSPFTARTGVQTTRYATADLPVLTVRGFDYLVQIRDSASAVPDSVFQAVWSRRPLAVHLLRGRDTLLIVPLDSMLAQIRRDRAAGRGGRASSEMNPDLFVTDAEGRAFRARVVARSIEVRDSAGVRRVASLGGRVLIAPKR